MILVICVFLDIGPYVHLGLLCGHSSWWFGRLYGHNPKDMSYDEIRVWTMCSIYDHHSKLNVITCDWEGLCDHLKSKEYSILSLLYFCIYTSMQTLKWQLLWFAITMHMRRFPCRSNSEECLWSWNCS